jgi:hypothetical protein
LSFHIMQKIRKKMWNLFDLLLLDMIELLRLS